MVERINVLSQDRSQYRSCCIIKKNRSITRAAFFSVRQARTTLHQNWKRRLAYSTSTIPLYEITNGNLRNVRTMPFLHTKKSTYSRFTHDSVTYRSLWIVRDTNIIDLVRCRRASLLLSLLLCCCTRSSERSK